MEVYKIDIAVFVFLVAAAAAALVAPAAISPFHFQIPSTFVE